MQFCVRNSRKRMLPTRGFQVVSRCFNEQDRLRTGPVRKYKNCGVHDILSGIVVSQHRLNQQSQFDSHAIDRGEFMGGKTARELLHLP